MYSSHPPGFATKKKFLIFKVGKDLPGRSDFLQICSKHDSRGLLWWHKGGLGVGTGSDGEPQGFGLGDCGGVRVVHGGCGSNGGGHEYLWCTGDRCGQRWL
ncbi:hypothetical protein M8C21_008318 [Ambrosia artemisiifolia]|uniref:Uncharacterized protein n=1 Tax=Ambrosia artemisiifolia TaxID=4212 RepID=A0AAD5C506_AMBAR|nr:hypothetical protein M8C21_008318 [Ambrosia artemisiifolia]